MKINIIVPGKFHAFELAKQLQKKNLLEKIITTYPKYLLTRFNIPKNKIKSFLLKELIQRIFIKFKFDVFLNKIIYFLNYFFEIYAANTINYEKINIIIGWSGCSEASFLKSLQINNKILKILERGSTHILYQSKILNEEYQKFGIKNTPVDERIIKKETREYDIADYIMVPSEFAKNSFLSYKISEKKILKIPYGVDLSVFRKTENKPIGFNIVCAGQISFRKGSYYLLKAFSELKLRNSKLILVGHINQNIVQTIKPFFSNNDIIFKGHVSQNKLKEIYDESHLFVTPSIEEGLAVVQAQAMASGIPLICTTNSGGADIVDENINGFVCPIRDINYLKQKILYLYENPRILKSFCDEAYQKSQKSLSWDFYGKKIVDTYENLIRKET